MTDAMPAHQAPDNPRRLVFAEGIPGFEQLQQFELDPIVADSPFLLLRSVDEPSIEFVVVAPDVLYPDYEIELDDEAAAALGLTDASDALVLAIVTLGSTLAASTVNLLGPVVANRTTRAASQVILNGTGFSTKTPLLVG
jgi:flagellar assembly factor FliW